MEFKVGDNAVYPSYGVGQVCAIETKNYGGIETTFYSIRILETGAKIMVPKNSAKASGLRAIINVTEAEQVFDILKKTDIKIDNQTWNRRYREYMEKIKTGSIFEIAEVLRDLFLLKLDKELSFGERKLLDQARALLIKELSLSTSAEEQSVESEIKQIFGL